MISALNNAYHMSVLQVKPIISLPYTNFPNFKFFGMATYGSPGQWIIHGQRFKNT